MRAYEDRAAHTQQLKAGTSEVPVREELAVRRDGRELLVRSVFAIDGRPDPVRLSGLLKYGIQSIWRAPTASVTAMAAECRPDCEHARAALAAFGAEVLPVLLASNDASGSIDEGSGGL